MPDLWITSLAAGPGMDLLATIASLKLRGDRLVKEVQVSGVPNVIKETMARLKAVTAERKFGSRRKKRRTRHRFRRTLSDDELEAELELRKARRAREKDKYKKKLEGRKLNALEDELSKLRSELSFLSDKPNGSSVRFSATQSVVGPGLPAPPPPPPGPPPPPALGGGVKKTKETYAERRARELGNKPKKPMPKREPTLLDCIREAGQNPQARLKKSGTISIDSDSPPEASDDVNAKSPEAERSVEGGADPSSLETKPNSVEASSREIPGATESNHIRKESAAIDTEAPAAAAAAQLDTKTDSSSAKREGNAMDDVEKEQEAQITEATGPSGSTQTEGDLQKPKGDNLAAELPKTEQSSQSSERDESTTTSNGKSTDQEARTSTGGGSSASDTPDKFKAAPEPVTTT
mmetsp:Transcript_3198/g.9755  ORF Transcript_3198/g.9755 Transcript_3198/m.9755 type:complete len:407 (-) Transcript_3198:221-1441(-)